jgi:hypothetical protein
MLPETDHAPLDHLVAKIAARQHGVVDLRQLIAIGLTASGVRKRVGAGRLHRIHAGVYAVGHTNLSLDGKRMAAVLACGPAAVLSYRDAAEILGLRPHNGRLFDVTSPRRTGRRKPGIRVHSGATLTARDITAVRAIPSTAVPRTLLDLAEVVKEREVERAIERAETLNLFDLVAIRELLDRSPGRRGARKLERALGAEPAFTRNDLEELMFAIALRAGVPRPLTNYWIGKYQADFAWPEQRLIAETDGRATHATTHAFEHDRLRDRELVTAGWRVIRFTYRQLEDDADEAVAALRKLLLPA